MNQDEERSRRRTGCGAVGQRLSEQIRLPVVRSHTSILRRSYSGFWLCRPERRLRAIALLIQKPRAYLMSGSSFATMSPLKNLISSTRASDCRFPGRSIGTVKFQQRRRFSLINTIDAVVPRSRFGCSIYTTPMLLLLRIFYRAAPINVIRSKVNGALRSEHDFVQFEHQPLEEHIKASGWSNKSSAPSLPSRSLSSTPSPHTSPTPPLLTSPQKSTVQSFHTTLLANQEDYASYVLVSLTWVKALQSHLSHEYIQFIIEDTHSKQRHRLLIDRQDSDDYIHSGPHLRDLTNPSMRSFSSSASSSRSSYTSATSEDEEKEKQDLQPTQPEQYHTLPLPLISLSFTHLPHGSRPTLQTLTSLASNLSTSHPNYDLNRYTCWWYAESILEGMLSLSSPSIFTTITTTTEKQSNSQNKSSQGAIPQVEIKEWEFAHLRYSFVVRMPRWKVLRREKLSSSAERFRERCYGGNSLEGEGGGMEY